jgi:hypothetical protein
LPTSNAFFGINHTPDINITQSAGDKKGGVNFSLVFFSMPVLQSTVAAVMKNEQTRRTFCRTCMLAGVATLGTIPLSGRPGTKPSGHNNDKEKKKMTEMIANCGIVCTRCPAYIATLKNDDTLRKKTASEWSKMFHADIKPEDINCLGCLSQAEPLFSHCFECEIRKCCQEKQVANCAVCSEFPCKKISDFMAIVPEAKAKLDELRKKG